MKILQICSSRTIGGGERHVADLSHALQDRSHDVYAAIAPGSPMRSELSLPAADVVELPFRSQLDISTARKLAKFVSARGVDLMHAHTARDYLVAALASRITGVPFVITRHVLFPMSRLHRIFLRNVRFVIAPSDAVASSLRRQRIFQDEKLVTIRHGLDAGAYQVRQQSERDEFVIGSIGNLDPVKGFDVLIGSAPAVIRSFPQARFVIAGEDRSSDRRHERGLRALIKNLDLEEQVELIGWSEDIRQTLGGFDLFVSSSRSESFGYAIAEAMLSGVPVIATETEGAKELISEPSVGVLVPIDSAEALAAAIIDLIQEGARRDELVEAGRRHIKENFSIQRMVEETEAVYRRAAEPA